MVLMMTIMVMLMMMDGILLIMIMILMTLRGMGPKLLESFQVTKMELVFREYLLDADIKPLRVLNREEGSTAKLAEALEYIYTKPSFRILRQPWQCST